MHETRLLNALASLNDIGASINRITPEDAASVNATLQLIVESAIKVIPGTSAVIYAYNAAEGQFDPSSRVSASEPVDHGVHDEPRPNGLGRHAIRARHRVLSYDVGAPQIHPLKVSAGARSVACFPLIVADEVLGALYVYLHVQRPFDELELLLLENFVNLAATALYHTRQVARIQLDLTRREEEIARLRHASLLISSRPNLQDTLDAILKMALEVTGARYGNFLLFDKSRGELVFTAVAGERLSRPYMVNIPIDANSVIALVARNRQPVCIPDLHEEPWASIYLTFDHDIDMRSELTVPLLNASGRLEAVLNLESPEPNQFSEQDTYLLQSLAMQAIIAIQEVRLLDALKELTKVLMTLPHRDVLQKIAELALTLLNGAAAAVWRVEGDYLILQARSGEYAGSDRVPLRTTLIGQAVVNREIVSSANVRTDPRFRRPDLAQTYGWKRALIAPISAGEDTNPIGAFSVLGIETSPSRQSESDWDTKVLTILADYAALAIINAEQQSALQQAKEQRTVAETFAALGDAAANLLHQLNNRIGLIPVRVQGIQDKCEAALNYDPYLANNLALIESSAHEAMSLVRDHLNLLHPIHLGPVDVATCVQEAIEIAQLPAGVQVSADGLEPLPLVLAGRQSLTLVFMNLLENAANAMQGSGQVVVRGSQHNGWIEVDIGDTGPGISSQLHDQIFEFNFSAQANAHAGKLGFGLWWIRTLMMRLGGSISVESDGKHGTTFRLRLPRHQNEERMLS